MFKGGNLAAKGRCMCAPLLIILALAAPISEGSEPKSRIRYAEPVQVQASRLPGSAGIQSAGTPALLSFDAYGRRFVLELESNERLLRGLPATRRAELPPHDIYRGKLVGLPGSWVRLTRLPDGIYGAIWDGSEFYSIAPAHTLAEFMGSGTATTSDKPLIYRASDVDMPGGPRFCAVLDPTGGSGKPITGLDQYKGLLRELPQRATAAAVATLELEVAMIADFEFFSAEVDPAGALLSRLNVVDGIFSEQVGVAITASELKVFDDPADPFTTSDAGTLLDQVGRYRVATPAIAATGLAHLVTGRNLTRRNAQNDLDDSIIGIAYLFGVCEAEIGVSVSERLDPFSSALVAAHEFGHNFGAPHDGEAGSPCQAAGLSFLMSPRLNDSSTFSQCSRNQMAPVIAESSCIRTRQYVDLAVEMTVTDYAGHTRIPEAIQFDVVNTGTRTADGAIASIDLDHSLTPTSISAEGGSCTVESGDIGCQLGNIPAGARRRVRFDVTAAGPGSTSSSITVAIDGDVDQGNNQGAFVLIVAALGNASVAMSPASRTVRVGETFESPGITVRALEQTEAVRVRITVPPELIIEGVAQHAGPCSVSNGTVDCDFGDMQFADQRDTFMSLRATQAGSFTIAAEVIPLDDSDPSDNSATVTIDVDPAAQPPRQEPPTSSGGGGGAIDWTCLLLGALAVGLRRKRRPAAVVHPRQVHSARCSAGPAH